MILVPRITEDARTRVQTTDTAEQPDPTPGQVARASLHPVFAVLDNQEAVAQTIIDTAAPTNAQVVGAVKALAAHVQTLQRIARHLIRAELESNG